MAIVADVRAKRGQEVSLGAETEPVIDAGHPRRQIDLSEGLSPAPVATGLRLTDHESAKDRVDGLSAPVRGEARLEERTGPRRKRYELAAGARVLAFVVVAGRRGVDEVHAANGALAGLIHPNLRVHGAGPHGSRLMLPMIGCGGFDRVGLPAISHANPNAERKREKNGSAHRCVSFTLGHGAKSSSSGCVTTGWPTTRSSSAHDTP